MYEVTVESGFSSGHYLRNYHGKCENPHGHNYKVRLTLRGRELDPTGLLLDFKMLKQVMRPVIDRIDHQMLNDLEPFTELNPSAENLARYFYDETSRQLSEMTGGRVAVKDCTIGKRTQPRQPTTSEPNSQPCRGTYRRESRNRRVPCRRRSAAYAG
jgi:6-pyruvoyltetrahydropterin/6-carboxytetrahydropterin synthase